MINRLHSLLNRPAKGFDPITPKHAEWYADLAWRERELPLVDQIEQWIDGLDGKSVLDLGGGPGRYSVAFAQKGARVVWHDISRVYQGIAQRHAEEAGVEIEFSLGYMEDAPKLLNETFDLVFNLVCWYYCIDDCRFARIIYSLMKPGGACYIKCNTPEFELIKGIRRLQYFLNNYLWCKVGHPFPPHKRIANLLHSFAIDRMIVNYTSKTSDEVFFVKSMAS